VPIVVGGDDSQLFATVRGFHDAVEGSVALIHFDAHLDLLDESREQGRYSQSSGMRRCLELERLSPERSMQVAVRNFNFPSSDEVAKESGLGRMTAAEFHSLGTHDAVAKIATRIRGADHVVFSFDIDAVDPAFAPGAGAHEPGGLTSRQALDAVRMLAPRCSGFAVAEVNPMTDVGDVTSTLAAYLVWSFAVYGAPDASPSS
jgi:agmatinase